MENKERPDRSFTELRPDEGAPGAGRAKAAKRAKGGARQCAPGQRGDAGCKPARAPAPDPELFAWRGARWRVRLGAFAGAAADPCALRMLLAPSAGPLEAVGADVAEVPDDLLVAAAACGALTSMPLLDIFDGGCFAPAACLCCYAAHSAAKAREAAASLRLFRKYYDAGSYLQSRAYARVVGRLSRDLQPEEMAEIREHVGALDETPGGVRELNATDGLCVAVPACQPGVLWVYSTPAARRLLRHLARGLGKGGPPLRVTVASSDPAFFPRFRFRMYAVSFLRAPREAEDLGLLLDAALAWARGEACPASVERRGGQGPAPRAPLAPLPTRAELHRAPRGPA